MLPELRRIGIAMMLPAVAFAARAEAGFIARATVESDIARAHAGIAVASAGDVNGDGLFDLLVGAPYAGNGQLEEGRVYLYLGTPSGPATTPAWSAESNQAGALFGYAVVGAGDVDGDGYDDIAIGAPLWDGGQIDEGAVFVYLGSEEGLSATPAWILESNKAGALFGAAIAGPGDVDFDGYNDLLIGAPQYTDGHAREGRAYLFMGSLDGLNTVPSWTVESNIPEAQFGHAVAFADVNGDIQSDALIGAPYAPGATADQGFARLYLAGPTNLSTTAAWSVIGDRSGARFGASVTGGDDFNGDGYDDIAVGAPGWSRQADYEGAAYVYLGDSLNTRTTPTWTFEGGRAESGFGRSVVLVGDVNDDGFGDLAIGAPGWDGAATRSGAVFLRFGDDATPTGGAALPPPVADEIDGSEPGGAFGSVLVDCDVNDDFISELLVGSPAHSGGQVGEGAATWFAYNTVVTSVDPVEARRDGLAIDAIVPNPARGRVGVAFSLPRSGPATIELMDITGRRMVVRDVSSNIPGRHRLDLTDVRTLAPGIYLVRLVQGSAVATSKIAVVR